MSKTVMVIAAHPDDEVIGCGGTIARHIKSGDKVHCLIMAEGITSRDLSASQKTKALKHLEKSVYAAHKVLHTTSVVLEHLPDNKMDSVSLLDIIKIIEKYINKYSPQVVYTHYWNDLNIDHRMTSQAVTTACRPGLTSVNQLMYFEILSSTEWQFATDNSFHPTWFNDITSTLNKKINAIKKYSGELRNWPHPRSVKGIKTLAYHRGSTVGFSAAEAFILAILTSY